MKMTKLGMHKKQKGFLTLDAALALMIAVGYASYVSAKGAPLIDNANEQIVMEDILSLTDGARNYKTAKTDGYTSVSVTNLSAASAGYINEAYGTGSGKNPFGGNYTVAVGSSAGELVITATGLSNSSCARVAEKFNKYTTATCATGTVTVNTI